LLAHKETSLIYGHKIGGDLNRPVVVDLGKVINILRCIALTVDTQTVY